MSGNVPMLGGHSGSVSQPLLFCDEHPFRGSAVSLTTNTHLWMEGVRECRNCGKRISERGKRKNKIEKIKGKILHDKK